MRETNGLFCVGDECQTNPKSEAEYLAHQQPQQQKPKSANSGATSRRRPATGALSGAATRVGVGAAHASWGGSGRGSGSITSAFGGGFGAALAPCGDYNGAARLAAPHTNGSLGPASVRVTPSSSAQVPANTPHPQQQQRSLCSNSANACESDCLPIIVGTAGSDCDPAVFSSSPSSSPSVSPRRRRPRGGDDYGGRLVVDCSPPESGQGERDGRASGGFAISFGVDEEGAAPIPIAMPPVFCHTPSSRLVVAPAPGFSTHTNAKSTAYYSNEVVTTSLDFYLFGLRIRGAEVDALAAASAAALDSAATFPNDAEAKGTAKGSNAEGSQLHGGGKSRGDEGIAGHQKHSPPDTVRYLDVLFPPTDDASSADRDSRDVFSSSHSSHFSESDALLRDPAAAAHSVCPSSSTATSSSPAALLVAMATRILGTDWRTYDGSRAAFAPRCPSLLWRL